VVNAGRLQSVAARALATIPDVSQVGGAGGGGRARARLVPELVARGGDFEAHPRARPRPGARAVHAEEQVDRLIEHHVLIAAW
jgi:hypothetical protein